MKLKNLVLSTFILILFTACNKDDDPTIINVEESQLIGEWALVDARVDNGKISTTGLGQTVSGSYKSLGENYDMSITFSESPAVITSTGSFETETTVTTLGQSETTTETTQDSGLEGSWELDGNVIKITNPSQTISESEAIITELNDGSMKLRVELDETLSEFGLTITTSGTFEYTLEKK